MSQRIEQASRDTAPAGSLRFNTDSLKLEIYNGEAWWNVDATSPDQQTGGTRMLIVGGKLTHPARQNVIQFINLDTIGNAIDFGDLLNQSNENHVASSRTRGLFYSGTPGPTARKNTIDYVTIQTKGNAIDFGDITTSGNQDGASHGSNLTRSVNHAPTDGNTIEYLTIATLGNTIDFGDATHVSDSKGGIDNSNGSID